MENEDLGISPIMHIVRDLDEYQSLAKRTSGYTDRSNEEQAGIFGAIAIAGEAGELLNYMKKVIYHRHPFSEGNYINELGDILWYVAVVADLFNVPLSMLASENIEKLKRRYPEGKFTTERSLNREE